MARDEPAKGLPREQFENLTKYCDEFHLLSAIRIGGGGRGGGGWWKVLVRLMNRLCLRTLKRVVTINTSGAGYLNKEMTFFWFLLPSSPLQSFSNIFQHFLTKIIAGYCHFTVVVDTYSFDG